MDAHDGFTTLVALRTKAGELAALRALSQPDQVRRVQPLLQLDPSRKNPADQLDDVEGIARELRLLGRPCWIDSSDVADQPGFGAGGAMGQLADRLSGPADLLDTAFPVEFIPVVRSDAAQGPAAALGRLGHELGAGAALRVRRPVVSTDRLAQLLEWVDLDPSEIDVALDFQYVAEVTTVLVDEAAAILTVLAGLGGFRSVSLLAGSIPKTLDKTATWEQPRTEEVFWDALVQAGAATLRLGDYGAVHPISGPGFRSNHVALKYTCRNHWLYSRERMPEHDDHDDESPRGHTLRAVCRHLVESDSFAGPDFSWGDHEIHEAAIGRGSSLGVSSQPVALATSHHLAYLAGRQAA
ncbi:beta family protein [Amycolatopsis eburnea]|uniref:beta family protein n=1 Tax=Amycolatopsis eburnea TaxID=2267691 RepID=UPI0013158EEC|nr:hypothetical protein [Amycolatopsis eburnea]